MGYTITGTTIKLTRGDTFRAEIALKKASGETYSPAQGDIIRFAMKSRRMKPDGSDYADSKPLILKTIPVNTMILKLEPEETKSLPFGTYSYDMEITYANGDVDTFIQEGSFELTKEVY